MFRSSAGEKTQSQATTPDLDDSISFSDDANPDVDVVDVDVESVATKKPHFLDYDAIPPPDFIEHFDRAMNFGNSTKSSNTTNHPQNTNNCSGSGSGEQLKMDKKFEKDGEISDYELAASGYTKKEFTQDDNTLNLNISMQSSSACGKPRKHFLDENPIPPDYMINEHQLREHRSLDRNFERHNEQRSALDLHGNLPGFRSSRERYKDVPPMARLPKGLAWTQSFDSRYEGNLNAGNKLDDFEPKVECVYSLLSMLGSNDPLEMAKKFHELSKNPETCNTLRRSGCIPLLVQIIHADGGPDEPRKWAGMALHNVVHSHPDEKSGRREAKVLRLLDQIMDYCNFLRTLLQSGGEAIADDADRHPLAAMSSLMKVSFDEEHRHAMCELGALQAIPSLVHLDHAVHGPKPENQCCNSLRRFALMALTNLTFGDENNKALLCSQKLFMEALVAQLDCAPDDLLQVTASVLRNLSWRADAQMKAVLNEIGTVTALAKAAMKNKCENTLKAILSALWNLSAHCSTNKAEFCAVEGALSFIVRMLTYEGPSKTLKIIENAGGILRNVSSHIAVREDYRQILREHNCLSILLQQLKSESLTVVSNSCGTLWNLSARCPEDQRFLWDNGAVPMLRSLIHSKHAMISEGSACALKNLLNFRPSAQNTNHLDPIARSLNLKKLPTLNVRKQKALEQELGAASKKHSETCDNLDTVNPKDRPTYDATATTGSSGSSSMLHRHRFPLHAGALGSMVMGGGASSSGRLTRSAMLTKSESRDSVFSAKSDGVVYDQLMRSHSASDANRKLHHASSVRPPPSASAVYALPRDVEPAEEQPIDYAQKYTEHISKHGNSREDPENNAATYQETDLDQPTDFSLRYAENQLESDIDLSPPSGQNDNVPQDVNPANAANGAARSKNQTEGSEILLILEDSVKCYQTEDTPYVISNAASVTDLRSVQTSDKNEENDLPTGLENPETPASNAGVGGVGHMPTRKFSRGPHQQPTHNSNPYGSGSYTPEKPVNYCEEGTPGYFSRYESLSSLDESPPQPEHNTTTKERHEGSSVKNTAREEDTAVCVLKPISNDADKSDSPPEPPSSSTLAGPAQPQINSALETPLMFSRRSSMDSLAEEDVGPLDDKSSVVSDFSRLASGVISPSEIPDSPTQSMPQSPRRNSNTSNSQGQVCFSGGASPNVQRTSHNRPGDNTSKRCLRSVFEDDISTFHVENTPAQFSTATSLSNLSMMDEEASSTNLSPPQPQPTAATTTNTISEGEEEEDGNTNNNDDLLLASCINMGMNRAAAPSMYSQHNDNSSSINNPVSGGMMAQDEPKQYYTEDTPALLSKVGSNTNLSAISLGSSNNDAKDDTVYETIGNSVARNHHQSINRRSLNLSDDMSSNASESGAAGIDILQQCIREGMQKSASAKEKPKISETPAASHRSLPPSVNNIDPIAMLRRGGNVLPPYLTGNDEMSKYRVEDSPCNFSVMSGLSNLTVGSSLVGPALLIHGGNSGATSSGNNNNSDNSMAPLNVRTSQNSTKPLLSAVVEDARREPQWQDDSLSSLSIESEDDTNLLSQAIAAGCNRPKSNLGFTTNLTSTGNHKTTPSLSSSQPIPINAATSASSLTSQTTARQFDKPQPQPNGAKQPNYGPILAGNESYSSVESSDSNDNQSKSLFELCILTGMHKNRDSNMGGGSSSSSRKHTRSSHSHRTHKNGHNDQNTTQSNPNLKQFDSLPMQGKQLTPNRHVRERDRRDEKLLMECINTGIMKKIGESCKQQNPPSLLTREALVLHNNQPKNGQATSAAAQMEELIRPQSAKSMDNSSLSTATSINTTTTITAAPDVEKNDNISNNLQQTITSNIISHDEDINDQRNPFNSVAAQHRNPAVPPDENLPSLASDPEITNGIGCKSDEPEDTQNGQSDESNQSFIMETTVSLESRTNDNSPEKPQENEKHKDPDLMLKSVERLTLEFVSSAEQLRTNSTGPAIIHHNFINVTVANDSAGDCTTTASISNDTWDEDTCPNDVSFPSVSISAPKVISITYDEDDEDQATTADYKELNDFAENTPNIDELPPPDLSLDFDNIGVNQANGNGYNYDSQPSSMDCYTDKTLVNENVSSTKTDNGDDGKKDRKDNPESEMENSACGLNFKLGGIVQTAAAAPSLCFNVNAMTNSTFIAQEARKLANNLQAPDTDGEEELTFSINSLDLDNIRPPSGMDSLNISGYYQDSHTQPNSLQNSPQMYFKSPKFPRKTLPAGLVARRALGQMPPHLSGSAESVNSSCNLLLDNIKPPSLMDELLDSMISVSSIQSEIADDCASMATTVTVSNYETANGGVTLGCEDGDTITLRSYSEDQLPRDDEQHTYNDGTITPLPSDYDFSSAESTPKKSYSASPSMGLRNLTPKQKRQVVKDRYRTYTIDGEMSEELRRKIEESQKDETLQIEITSYDERNATTSVENGKYDDDDGQKQDSDLQNTPRSRRRSSQERYRTQTISYSDLQAHITQGTNYTDITSNYTFTSDNVATSDNETNTRLDQDLTSLEYDQNSETESCHNFETKPHVLTDCEEEQELEDAEMEIVEKQSVVRPRIVIPGESTAINDESTENGDEEHASPVKTIRGGKKPQYVSPYSMKFQKTIDTSKPTKAQGPTTGTATKPNGQLRKPNGASVASTNTKLAQKKPLKDAAKDKAQDVAAPVPPLERQGTFVKDEPSVDASTVPVVETSPKKSKLSKLPMKRQLSSSSNTSPQKTANTRKLPTSANSSSSSLSATNKRNFGGSITKPQRANSNVNIRVTTNAARIAVLSTRVSTTTPPSRSNSTLNSANAAVTAAQNAAAKINQAQSRIAGIWRRVDEAKNRQQTTTKINNNNTKGSQLSGKTTTMAQAASSPRPGTLVRSTTFDNSPPLTTVVAAKPKAGGGNVAATGPGKSNGGSVAASTKIAMAQRQILGIRK